MGRAKDQHRAYLVKRAGLAMARMKNAKSQQEKDQAMRWLTLWIEAIGIFQFLT